MVAWTGRLCPMYWNWVTIFNIQNAYITYYLSPFVERQNYKQFLCYQNSSTGQTPIWNGCSCYLIFLNKIAAFLKLWDSTNTYVIFNCNLCLIRGVTIVQCLSPLHEFNESVWDVAMLWYIYASYYNISFMALLSNDTTRQSSRTVHIFVSVNLFACI